MLTVNQTIRSYAGKPGCMCGCNGAYNDTPRVRKMAITQLLKDPRVAFHTWSEDKEGCLYVRTPTRNRVLYLTAEGVQTVRSMGVKEGV
jgi:hypothetical protein